MKHLTIGTLCVLIIFALIGCSRDNKVLIDKSVRAPRYTISVETIDSCEYIVLDGSSGRSIIHKQNCKNHK